MEYPSIETRQVRRKIAVEQATDWTQGSPPNEYAFNDAVDSDKIGEMVKPGKVLLFIGSNSE
jgi:hypothetical protein